MHIWPRTAATMSAVVSAWVSVEPTHSSRLIRSCTARRSVVSRRYTARPSGDGSARTSAHTLGPVAPPSASSNVTGTWSATARSIWRRNDGPSVSASTSGSGRPSNCARGAPSIRSASPLTYRSRQDGSTDRNPSVIRSSVRTSVSRASRSSVTSTAVPTIVSGSPSGPGSTRPRSVTHRIAPSGSRTRCSTARSPQLSMACCTAARTSGASSGWTEPKNVPIRGSKSAGSTPKIRHSRSSQTSSSVAMTQLNQPTSAAASAVASRSPRAWAASVAYIQSSA